MVRHTLSLALVFVLALVPTVPAQSGTPSLEEVAARLEQRLQTLRSLQADFEQFYHSASQSASLHEKGRFTFQRPNRLRWEYVEPEAKIFVYREGVFEQYYIEDNQLIRSRLTGGESGTEILALLAGEKKIRTSYAIEAGPPSPSLKNATCLKLTPLQEGEYTSILVEVEERSSLPARLVFTDLAGNSTEFLFKNPKADGRLPSGAFDLKVPPDCEVIDELPPDPDRERPAGENP